MEVRVELTEPLVVPLVDPLVAPQTAPPSEGRLDFSGPIRALTFFCDTQLLPNPVNSDWPVP